MLAEAMDWSGLPLMPISDPGRGKPVALNTALLRARGEWIAFTDDDCIVPRDWLVSVAREFDSLPAVGALGGRVEP